LKEVELQDVAEIIAGQSPKSEFYNETGDGVPFFQGKTDFGDDYPTVTTWCTKPKKMAKEGDILFSVRAPVGPTNIAKVDCCIGRGLSAIRPKEAIDRSYLRFYFKKVEEKISDQGRGSTFKAITQKDLKALKIPLPSLSDQKAIVAKLDRAQRLIDIDREMLAKYDDLIQSVFLEMFGDPVTNSKGWEVKNLGDLTTKVGSGSTPRGGSKVYQRHGIIFIRSQNVLMNKLDLVDVAYISDEIHEGMQNTWVQENDVLLNITGASIGRVCVYNKSEAANVNQHVCILRPIQEKIKPYYLSHLISSKNYQDKILGQQTGGTRQAFNMTQIKNFDIPLPPLELQTKFNHMLTKLKGEVQNLKLNTKKSEELFSSLLQKFFN